MHIVSHGLRTPNEGLFQGYLKLLGLGKQIGPINFWGIWDILGRTISTHFGTVSPLFMLSINQPLFLQKTKLLYSYTKYLFGIGI